MSIFGFKQKRSPSGHEISDLTPEEFLKDKNIYPAEEVPSSNERRIAIEENKRKLIDKLKEVKEILNNFSDLISEDKKKLLLPQLETIEITLADDDLSLTWLNNSIEFIDSILKELKDKI